MYLPCIIERLNQKITVANTNFAGAKYYNKLAWLVNRDVNGTSQQFPLVDEENETEIAIDDIYPLTVYHRLLSKPYSEKNYQFDVANCQMLMIVFANKDKVKMDAEALESQLISLFPKQFNSDDRAGLEGVTDISIKLGTSNLSATDVFNSEYRGARLAIDRNIILFSVRYDINITFKRDCLNFCEAVSQPDSLCDWIEISTWDSIGNCMSVTQLNEARAEICSPAIAVLKNTALTTISTTSIAGGLTQNITAPDATAVLKNSVGTVIDTEAIPSNVSQDITIANVAWTDSDGSAESTAYGNAIVCTGQVKTVELYFAFTAGTDTSTLATNGSTTWTLTAISDDGSSGSITVDPNGGGYAAFVNPTTTANGETIQVKRTTTTGAGWVLITGTYA